MKNKNLKKVIIVSVIMAFIIILTAGITLAYLTASNSNNNVIKGSSYQNDMSITLTPIKKSTSLVPFSDDEISKAITDTYNCTDKYGEDICSIFKVDITNNGDNSILYSYVSATNSTFTSNNLKYKVFTKNESTYTGISDIMTLSNTNNEKVYFQNESSNYSFNLENNQTITYYFVFWISEQEQEQNEDMDKTYNGVIGVESTMGDQITAKFSL